MADRLILSCWLRGFHALTAPRSWEKLLGLFPYSKLGKGMTACRVLAISEHEPALFDNLYPVPFDPEVALEDTNPFYSEDCAFQLDTWWDLMLPENGEWRLAPVRITVWLLSPEFESDAGEHVRIEFGPEDPFLPPGEDPVGVRAAESNLRSLMRLVQDIDERLQVERKHLWSESGANFALKLREALGTKPDGLALQ